MLIENLQVDSWNDLPYQQQMSRFRREFDIHGQRPTASEVTADGLKYGLKFKNFTVAGEVISIKNKNCKKNQLGRIAFDESESKIWTAVE